LFLDERERERRFYQTRDRLESGLSVIRITRTTLREQYQSGMSHW
jgi:hypothetical protein